MKKQMRFIVTLLCCCLLFTGCGQQEQATVSIAAEDYDIVYEEAAVNELKEYSLEKLGAFYLHADGAFSEGAADELYRRFLAEPDIVLQYFSQLGEQTIGEDKLAVQALCEALALCDVVWYDCTDEFAEALEQCTDGEYARMAVLLQDAYDNVKVE